MTELKSAVPIAVWMAVLISVNCALRDVEPDVVTPSKSIPA